jgi:acylphosphatase
MDEERMRVRAIVSGRVQGVWFRQSTADEAERIGVAGWVRNLEDGRVEAVFEGTPEAVGLALAYLDVGPQRARVDEVEAISERPEGLIGFHVR